MKIEFSIESMRLGRLRCAPPVDLRAVCLVRAISDDGGQREVLKDVGRRCAVAENVVVSEEEREQTERRLYRVEKGGITGWRSTDSEEAKRVSTIQRRVRAASRRVR